MLDYTSSNIRTWSRLGSCGAFGIAAMELPNINENVVILTSDLCFFSGLERFNRSWPDRLYNCGIAEQNMVCIAAGMAKEGFTPFATTYATFASMRCADQVRVNMGYMKLGIKLVGLTSGLSIGILGPTHMSIEDIAVMRAIPNITILSPADCTETIKSVIASAQHKGPVYLRLSGTMGAPIVYKSDYNFTIGTAITLKEGTDIAIIATGTMVYNSLLVANELEKIGISTCVVNMHTIKPLDIQTLKEASLTKLMVTIEEHSVVGGLGSAVAETLANEHFHIPLLIIGLPDEYYHAANYSYLIHKAGLSPEILYKKILNSYNEVQND